MSLEQDAPFKQHASRWYILAVFSLLAAVQCLAWGTFSQAPVFVGAYYGLLDNNNTIGPNTQCTGRCATVTNLLLNWGPIAFLPVLPISSWLAMQPNGLWWNARIGATLTFLGCVIRALPCVLFSEEVRLQAPWYCLIFLHVGQILNAANGTVHGTDMMCSSTSTVFCAFSATFHAAAVHSRCLLCHLPRSKESSSTSACNSRACRKHTLSALFKVPWR